MAKLTAREATFVQEYLISLNATEAAKKAGYSERSAYSTAYDLMRKPHIKAIIDAEMTERAKRNELTASRVLKQLEEIYDRCMQKEQVLDAEGNPTGEWQFASQGALRATELQGKYLSMWKEKTDHDHSGEVNVTIRRLTKAESSKK